MPFEFPEMGNPKNGFPVFQSSLFRMSFLSLSARALAPFRLRLPAAGVLAVRAAPVRHIGATASALPAPMRRVEWVVAVQTRRITTSAPLRSEVKDTEEALRDLGDLFGEARMEIEVPSEPAPPPAVCPPAETPATPTKGTKKPHIASCRLLHRHLFTGCARLGGDHVLQ